MIVVTEFFDKDTKEKLDYTPLDRFYAILGDWKERYKAKDLARYRRYLEKFGNPDCKGKIVLDIGCGAWGGILRFIKADRKIAIDPLIGNYQKMGIFDWKGSYLDCDAEKIDLPDDYADIVFCLNTLDHCFEIESPRKVIKEIHRILKPEGKLYLHTHLRKGEQLNLLHFYGIEEKDLDRWLGDFKRILWEIDTKCEVWERPYNTFWGILENG